MRHLPPLNALRVFDAAARRLNFSAAAEELCVTHSAISHQIRQLEDWLGQPLFVRHSSGVHLTSAGLSLQQANGRALSLLEEACAKLAQTTQTSEIILGAPGSFLANWLIPRLERFENTHPQIRLRLQTSAELTELATRRVDVLIISAKSWPRQVHAHILFNDAIGPVCAPDWPEPLDSAQHLSGQALLHTRSQPHAWSDWAEAQGQNPADFELGRHFDHLPLMLEAAAAGLGIAIAPAMLVEREIATRRLIAPLGFAHCGAAFACCCLPNRQHEPALAALCDWLQSEAHR